MKAKTIALGFPLILSIIFSLPIAQAATFTVTNLNDSGSGSLRQAVLDANADITGANTIGFQAGLTGTIILTRGLIEISGQLTITGPGADVLAVSGNKVSRVFVVQGPGPTTIQGLTIKEGREEQGGGIYSVEGFLTLNHLTFSNNLAMNAANAATSGEGGGLYNKGSTLTVMNSTLSDNTAGSAGGGIHNFNGPLTVSNSTLSGNIAGVTGGGIVSYGSTLTVINSTLSGNVAGGIDGEGGGIAMDYGALTVINSTLTGNTATRRGGGIFSMNIATVNNSLIVGNTASRAKEVYQAYWAGSFTSGYNLFGQQSLAGVESVTLLETDQVLAGLVDSAIGPLANNGGPTQTHLLVAGSPAINKGNNNLIPIGVTTDQRGAGFPRIVDITVDIGAVEGTTTGPITYALTISKTGGNGSVTSNPVGINCGATCTANFNRADQVILTATPETGYSFTGWLGDCTGTSCIVTMDANKNITATFNAVNPAAVPSLVFSGDYNGDGRADLIWHHETTGQVYGILLNGYSIAQQGMVYTESNTAWRIIHNGDFNGDGRDELLWWNNQTGQVYQMPMNGLSIVGGTQIYQESNTAWQIVAVGDLNGDRKDDLIWWNNSSGQVYGMLMDGTGLVQGGMIYQEANTTWQILAARDFNADGNADLLWRNTTTGQVYLMLMNGLSIAGGAMVHVEPNLAWSITAVGDLDGDRKADLIWRNDQTGQVYGMLMNGTGIAQGGMIYQEANTAWQIIASGDYTGDGKADLLWRNSQTGQVYEMVMSGLSIAGGAQIYQEANPNWRILAKGTDVPVRPLPSPGAASARLAGTPINVYPSFEGPLVNPPQPMTGASLNSSLLLPATQ